MEKLFGLFWKNKIHDLVKSPGVVILDEHLKRIESFTHLLQKNKIGTQVGGSHWSVGMVNSDLLLPRYSTWTLDQDLNFNLIKLLTIYSLATQELSLTLNFDDRERIRPRLHTLLNLHKLNLYLDRTFPNFAEWQKRIVTDFVENTKKENSDLYQIWEKIIFSREKPSQEIIAKIATLEKKM